MRNNRILIFLAVTLFTFLTVGNLSGLAQDRKIGQLEQKADRSFIRQKFDKAMFQYERAVDEERDFSNQGQLHLKVARLYFMVGQYKLASSHYGSVISKVPSLLDVNDVCDYIDALRFTGDSLKFDKTFWDDAYKNKYSHNQRYQNALEALESKHEIHTEPGYSMKSLSSNTPNAEFWIGNYNGQSFYAKSFSAFNDPGKIFFHRTHYYVLNEKETLEDILRKAPKYYDYFKKIPADMQNGPVTFSPDMKQMITTVIEYDKRKISVQMANREHRPFRTKLFSSTIKDGQRKFSKLRSVFPQEKTSSYAHPFLFNDGKSLLFTSDMPGGYGGFDLYVVHWDEALQQWGKPINLGPKVNTEGNEISPVIFENKLIFSSNGLPGFGGYDLFSIEYDKDVSTLGTLNHFPYPVNSAFNDYYMCPLDDRNAYFVSDRNMDGKDDIYYLTTIDKLGTQKENVILGDSLLLNDNKENVIPEYIKPKKKAPEGLLLTLYFDFDSFLLTPESMHCLHQMLNKMSSYEFSKLIVDGYADEMGSNKYNYTLSERRAQSVVNFLRENGIKVDFQIRAHGKIFLTLEEKNKEIQQHNWQRNEIDWIRVNRKARRVEIYNKKVGISNE